MSLYDPFIERDVDGIRAAARALRASGSSGDLFLAVARFAVLAWSPSEHGNRALLSCLAAHDLQQELGDHYDDVLIECGIYAAMARQPWSEAPILDPPHVDPEDGSDEQLRAAVAGGDRLRGERWLAARLEDEHLERSYFAHAASCLGDGCTALSVAAAAWRLAPLLGEKGRFATLRLGVWQTIAAPGKPWRERGYAIDAQPLLERLIDGAAASRGAIETMQPLFALDAAIEAESIAGAGIAQRVRDYLTAQLEATPEPRHAGSARNAAPDSLTPYPLARDCGSCLIAHAVAKRMRERLPGVDVEPLLAAAHDNLANGPSYEEWV